MPFIDIDDTLKNRRKSGFRVNSKDYVIQDHSYEVLMKVMDKEEELKDIILSSVMPKEEPPETEGEAVDTEPKESNAKKALRLQMEIVCLLVPELTPDFMVKELTALQGKHIYQAVRNHLSGDEEDELDNELKYYREKYKDEYRKNENAVEEKETNGK